MPLQVNPVYPSSDLLHSVLAVCHPILRQDGTMLGGASGLEGDADLAEASQVRTRGASICHDSLGRVPWFEVVSWFFPPENGERGV